MSAPIAISPDPNEAAVAAPNGRKTTDLGQDCIHNGLTMPLFAWVCLNFLIIIIAMRKGEEPKIPNRK